MKYLEGLPDEQKYREQTRIYERSNMNKKEGEDLLIQLFDYVEQSKTYGSVLSDEKFENNWNWK